MYNPTNVTEIMNAINKRWPYNEAKDYHNFNSIV